MDGLVNLLSMDWSRRIGWSLVHFIWQGAIIAGLFWLTLRLLARSRQQARYAAACLAMLFMAAAPIVTFFVVQPAAQELSAPSPQPSAAIYSEGDSWGNEEPASPTMPQTPMFDQYAASSTSSSTSLPDTKAESAPAVLNNAAVADNTKQPADEEHWTARISPLVEPAMPYAVAAWLAGVLICSLWHLGGWLKVQRIRRRGVPLTNVAGESHWLNAAQRFAETLRIGRAVRLLKLTGAAARDLAGPVVVGILRPTVMIPATVLTGLEPQQVEAILAHELAHIRRHDYLVNLLQALIETLLFYHPAVWWTSTRIRAERENCCDDLAVMALSVPAAHLDVHAAYAGALAALAEIVAMEKTFRPAGTATCIAPAAGGASSHMKRHARNAADRITSDRITSGADRIAPGAADNLLSRIRRLLGVDVCTSPRWTAALAGALILTGLLTGVFFYGCGIDSSTSPADPVNASAVEAVPSALTSVHERSCLEYPDIKGPLSQGLKVLAEAYTWDELVSMVNPTLTWGRPEPKPMPDRGFPNMMWIDEGPGGKPVFRVARALAWEPSREEKARWILVDWNSGKGDHLLGEHISGRAMPARLEVTEDIPDPQGDADVPSYAIVKAGDPRGGTVYEIGWTSEMCMGSGHWIYRNMLYVWRDAGGTWRLIGEGPQESWGKMGGMEIVATVCDAAVEWRTEEAVGTTRPVVSFVVCYWQYELGEGAIGLPDLITCRDASLEAVTDGRPEEVRLSNYRYVQAEKGDTLDSVVYRLAVRELLFGGGQWWSWHPYDTPDTALLRKRTIITQSWRDELLRLNPDLAAVATSGGLIPEGSRIVLPSEDQILRALIAADEQSPPAKPASPAVSQTIQQRKEALIAATPQMQYSFVRPDGVIVELAAVSAAPSEDKKWWLPDGSPVIEPLHRLIDGREPPKIRPPGNSFAILVRNIARTSRSRSGAGPIAYLNDQHDYQIVVRVEPKQVGMRLMENYFDDHSRTEDDRIIGMRDELRICSQSFEPAVTRADVKVGLTVGQWKTMDGGAPQSRGSTGTGEREVRYGYSPLYLADTTPGGEEVFGVTVSHQLAADQQVRVMAVLKDGTEIISRSSAMSDGKLGQINATFHRPGLKMDDIKSFKLQARPLEWVEFKNVALRPEDDAHATKQPLDIFSERPPLMVRLYPDDDQKAGLYAICLYVKVRLWSFEFLYKSAVEGEYVAAGNNELVGRLEGAFGEGDTFDVAEPVRDGDAIKVLVRYVRGEATKEPGGGAATGVKRAYLWGILRPDLPAGQYKVIVELVEHVRQDGKLIVAPKAANRAYERLTCEFEGSQANSAVGERAAGEKYDDAFAALIRQAIAARPAEGHSRRGADQNPTGLDLAALLKLSGQDNDLVEYPENAPAAKEGVARLKEARKIWALAGLLDHEHVDVKILAARALGEIADARSAAVLLAAAKANYYDVRGSENATLHMIYRSELREALGKVTGLDVKPHRGGLVLPGEVALERVERWLKEKFLPEEVGWGMTVNGLRARLICDVKQVIVGQPVPARLEIQCVEGIPEKSGRVQLFPHFDLWWDAGPDYGKRPLQHVTIKLPIENRNVIRKGETFKHEFDLAKALEIKAPDRYRVMAGHFNSLVSDLGDWTGDVRSEWVSFDVLADTPEQRAWVKEAWEFSERLRKLTIEELADRIVVKSEFSPGEHLDIRPVFRKKFANASPQMQAKIIKLFADQVIRLQVKQWEAPGTLHDRHHLIHYLADMGARAELLAILERQNGFDCCAAPAMIDGVVACGQPEDAWLLARKIPEISGDGGYVALHEAIQKLTDMKAEIPEAANNTHQAFRARNLAHARMWAEKLTSAGIGKADTLYFAIDDTWEKLAVMLLKEGTLWYEYGLTKTGPGGEESYDVSWRFLPVGGKQWVQFDIKQSMSQLRDLAVSPDRKRLAMLSSGEGHQMLDIFNLPALLEKRSGKPLHTVDPYPGGIWIVGWEGGLLRVSSDMPLSLPARDENGRILPVPYVDPVTLMMDEPREYLFDAATGKFTDVSENKTPTPPTPSTPPATDAISQLSASLLPDWVEQARVMARRQRAARNLQAIAQAMSVYAGPSSRHLPTVPQYRMRHFAGHWLPGAGRFGSDT